MKRKGAGKKVVFIAFVLVVGLFTLPLCGWAKTEIVWWHAMGGFLGERVNDITKKFNASQKSMRSRRSTREVIPKP